MQNKRVGAVPLHQALADKRLEIVEALLKYPNIDPNVKSAVGATPLDYAIISGDLKIVKALLKHHDVDIYGINMNGKTPLQMAKYFASKSVEIVEFIEREIEERQRQQIKEGSCYIN